MAGFVFDISKGRVVEFHNRVNDNDPANSALILLVLANSGLEQDNTLRTYALLSTLLAASNNEVTNTNYARKTFTDANIGAPTVDTTNHLTTLDLSTPLQTFASIAAGDAWRKALLCYDSDTTGGGDASIVPMLAYDIVINGAALVPNGNNINFDFSDHYYIDR